MKALLLGLLLASLVISGCTFLSPPKNVTNATPPAPPPAPAKTPIFSIVSPNDGDVIIATNDTTDVDLSMSTQNLILQAPGGAAKKGEGYFRVTVDNNPPVTVTSKLYTISALPAGNHTVEVDLYNNDRTPYSPPITKTIAFTIQMPAPQAYVPQNYTVSITPSASGTVGTEDFSPSNLTVKIGDSVTWVNNGTIPQSATCTQNGKVIFDTKTLGPGHSATITFNSLLECDYYSSLFRAMHGHVSVVSNGTGS